MSEPTQTRPFNPETDRVMVCFAATLPGVPMDWRLLVKPTVNKIVFRKVQKDWPKGSDGERPWPHESSFTAAAEVRIGTIEEHVQHYREGLTRAVQRMINQDMDPLGNVPANAAMQEKLKALGLERSFGPYDAGVDGYNAFFTHHRGEQDGKPTDLAEREAYRQEHEPCPLPYNQRAFVEDVLQHLSLCEGDHVRSYDVAAMFQAYADWKAGFTKADPQPAEKP